MRVGAGNELPRHHQPLLGKVEVEDAVARRRVVRLLDAVQRARTRGRSPVCLSSSSLAGEDEVIVGDRRLPRIDRVAAGDLVEGVDRKRRGAVRRRQQVGVDAQRRARASDPSAADPCRRGAPRRSARSSSSGARARRRASRSTARVATDAAELAPARPRRCRRSRRISSSFGDSGTGVVGLALRLVRQPRA